jgi:hypothetical protein
VTEITRQQTNMHKNYMQQVISHRGVMTWSVFHRGWGVRGVIMCTVLHQNGDRIFWMRSSIYFFTIIMSFFCWNFDYPGIHVFLSDQFSLLIYLCLPPSSATVKMDNGENMENARYVMNDDTAGFINQKKNRNTSTKTEYDLKLMTNYFASIYT